MTAVVVPLGSIVISEDFLKESVLERERQISQQVVDYISSVMNTQVTLFAFELSKRLLIA